MSKGETKGLVTTVSAVTVGDCVNRCSTDAGSGTNKQRRKIKQIGDALREAGFLHLDKQANALGLQRSTMWTIMRANHKTSGLRAALIGHMLSQKELPPKVRSLLREYVIEKARGDYGHALRGRWRFAAYFWDMPELADWLKR